jgi:hypothetical protein
MAFHNDLTSCAVLCCPPPPSDPQAPRSVPSLCAAACWPRPAALHWRRSSSRWVGYKLDHEAVCGSPASPCVCGGLLKCCFLGCKCSCFSLSTKTISTNFTSTANSSVGSSGRGLTVPNELMEVHSAVLVGQLQQDARPKVFLSQSNPSDVSQSDAFRHASLSPCPPAIRAAAQALCCSQGVLNKSASDAAHVLAFSVVPTVLVLSLICSL